MLPDREGVSVKRETTIQSGTPKSAQPDSPYQQTEAKITGGRLDEAPAAGWPAFDTLYRKYVIPVYRYFYRRVGNQSEAEDLTAAVFNKALASFSHYRERGSSAAWLFTIAHRTLCDYQRHYRPQVDLRLVDSTVIDTAYLPEDRVLQAERAATLHHLVQNLPTDQREALALRFFAGLRTAEVAAVLGRSEAATKMLVHRAIQTLREAYRQEGNL